jgi:alkylhydroperoxidase/carboxymuconolactone decarboxylase family protein YurZ
MTTDSSLQTLDLAPDRAAEKIAMRRSLDNGATQAWLDFASQLHARLDPRTRHLVLIAQFTATKSYENLEDELAGAVAAGVDPREIAEVILHNLIYVGDTAVEPAVKLFDRIVGPVEADINPCGDRDLDTERELWHPKDRADPRLEPFLERYGWRGISMGLQLQPVHHLDTLELIHSVDEDFADAWLRFCWDGMYARKVLDDKTRLLTVVGVFVATGVKNPPEPLRTHIRSVLAAGATKQEVADVIFLSAAYYGMPDMSRGLRVLLEVLRDNEKEHV